mgnify:CR=1 FL=1
MIRGLAHKTGRRTLHSLWIILAFTGLGLTASVASAQQLRTASLTPGDSVLREADLPPVLSAEDITRYRHMFALQQNERWPEADRDTVLARLLDLNRRRDEAEAQAETAATPARKRPRRASPASAVPLFE